MNQMNIKKVNLLLLGVAVVFNIAVFNFLPEQIGIHQNDGVMDQYVSKYLFAALLPVLLGLHQVLLIKQKKESNYKNIVLPLVFLALNVFIAFQNFN